MNRKLTMPPKNKRVAELRRRRSALSCEESVWRPAPGNIFSQETAAATMTRQGDLVQSASKGRNFLPSLVNDPAPQGPKFF